MSQILLLTHFLCDVHKNFKRKAVFKIVVVVVVQFRQAHLIKPDMIQFESLHDDWNP